MTYLHRYGDFIFSALEWTHHGGSLASCKVLFCTALRPLLLSVFSLHSCYEKETGLHVAHVRSIRGTGPTFNARYQKTVNYEAADACSYGLLFPTLCWLAICWYIKNWDYAGNVDLNHQRAVIDELSSSFVCCRHTSRPVTNKRFYIYYDFYKSWNYRHFSRFCLICIVDHNTKTRIIPTILKYIDVNKYLLIRFVKHLLGMLTNNTVIVLANNSLIFCLGEPSQFRVSQKCWLYFNSFNSSLLW